MREFGAKLTGSDKNKLGIPGNIGPATGSLRSHSSRIWSPEATIRRALEPCASLERPRDYRIGVALYTSPGRARVGADGVTVPRALRDPHAPLASDIMSAVARYTSVHTALRCRIEQD